MDVKGCSFGSRYSPARFFEAQTCDAVRHRQVQVHTDAGRKARTIDAKYNGWDPQSTVPGPMTKRLYDFGRVEGLVVGAHGEASTDLLKLISRLANRAAQTTRSARTFRSAAFRVTMWTALKSHQYIPALCERASSMN